MGASRVFSQAMVLMGLKTVGFARAFRDIRKGTKDSENALQKMTRGLSTATEGARTFTRDAVEGALEMSTRLAHMNVVMGGSVDNIEGLRKEQARMRVETGMGAEEADKLRMGLLEIGETSVDVAVQSAKTSKALQLDPETTVGWHRLGKEQGMTAQQTQGLFKDAGGLLTLMKVPPTAFFQDPAEWADILRTRTIALGKQSPEAINKVIKSAAALTGVMSNVGIGTDAAAATVREFASGSADAIFEMRTMMAGISSMDVPDIIKSAAILQQDFGAAMSQAADAPDAMIVQLARMTKGFEGNQEALNNWTAWVNQNVKNKAIAHAIVTQADAIISTQTALQASAGDVAGAFQRQLDAALKNPKALRDMRDEQMKVLKEGVALNEVFKVTNPLIELQTRALHWLATENEGVTGAMAFMGRGTFAAGGLIGEVAEKVSDFTTRMVSTGKALVEIKKAAPGVLAAITGISKVATKAVPSTIILTDGLAQIGPAAASAAPGFATMLLALLPLLGIIAGLTALTVGALAAFGAYSDAQERAGQAALNRASKERKAMVTAKKVSEERHDAMLFEAAQAKNLTEHLKNLEDTRGGLFRQVFTSGAKQLEISRDITRTKGLLEKTGARIEAIKAGRVASMGGVKPPVGATGVTPQPRSPTPVTPSSAFPPGGQMTRVAIQSLEEQRSQVGLLEQLVALMGGLPGAITPPGTGGGGGGGGGVNVTIRPDSGRMRLDKMLEVDAKNALGRAGYTQFGGRINSA